MNLMTSFDEIESNLTEEQEDKIDDLKNRMDGLPSHTAWFVLERLNWNVDEAAIQLGGRLIKWRAITESFAPVTITLPDAWDIRAVQAYAVFLFVQVMGRDETVDTITIYLA